MVEFALLLPILVVLLFGLVDLGRMYYAYVAISDAAGEGAAYGARNSSSDTLESEVKERAGKATEGLVEIDEDQVTMVLSSDAITVTVTYSVELLTPLVRNMVSGGVLPLTAVAVQASD